MKKISIVAATLLALAGTLPASGVRAKQGLSTVMQPDGTTLSVKTVGDEFGHFTLTSDDCLVTLEGDTWYFATIDAAGRTVSTGVPAAAPALRDAAQTAAADVFTADNLRQALRKRAKGGRRAIPQNGMGRYTSDFPRVGDIRGLVILVEYKDYKFKLSDPQGYFHDLLNKDGFSQYGGTGCAAEYFRENSHNQFRPVFDVLGPVTLANNRRYYGGNDSWGNDRAPQDMVVEAVKALDSTVDFSKYDLDGDGYVDNVFVFYAGEGEASSNVLESVWPHSWDLSDTGMQFKVDGVTVDHYACSNEWEGTRPDGVGTFIHEFSHVMGLPDLYDTESDLTCTPGSWSVLDYGPYNNDGRTPPNYSIYERNAMGWMEPEVIDGPASIVLDPLVDTNQGYIIQTPVTTEFFLLENRQQKGWDKYLPGHGMLIWHIDFNQKVFDDNVVNNTSSHQYVEIEKANGVKSSTNDAVLAGWAWPGTSGATSFTDNTSPSMKTWKGSSLGLPITAIAERGGVVTFDVAGGKSPIDAPFAHTPSSVGQDWFDASWDAVDGATDYYLTVMAAYEGGGEESFTNNMGSGKSLALPQGWTSSTTEVYSTIGNFGNASPSLKMAKSGVWIQSPTFESDVHSLSFWYKGQQSEGSYLYIYGVKGDGSQVTLGALEPEKNVAATYEISNVPAGVRAIRMEYEKSKGNLALDDITILTGGNTTEIVPGYDGVSTHGACHMSVAGLDTSRPAIYTYYVTATDGQHVSGKSNVVTVDLSTSVIGITSSAAIAVHGREVSVSEGVMSVHDIAGRCLGTGVKSLTLSSPGIYIVRAGGLSKKIEVR